MTAPASSSPDPPDAPSDSFLTPSGFDLQGHRGARGLAPENTLPAFRTALEIGVTTLEMDVVVTKDGRVVVSHEPWMSHTICRTPDGAEIPESEEKQHNIYEMTAAEVTAYDCGSRPHPHFPEQANEPAHKPLLREVLAMAEQMANLEGRDEPIFYNVETKSRPAWDGRFHPEPDVFAEAVVNVLRDAGVLQRSTIQSFDPRTLAEADRIAPTARLALLVATSLDAGLEANLEALPFDVDVYSPDASLVDRALLDAAHARGLPVVPWTVNDPDAMQRLIDLGVDGLITDYPNRAKPLVDAIAE